MLLLEATSLQHTSLCLANYKYLDESLLWSQSIAQAIIIQQA